MIFGRLTPRRFRRKFVLVSSRARAEALAGFVPTRLLRLHAC